MPNLNLVANPSFDDDLRDEILQREYEREATRSLSRAEREAAHKALVEANKQRVEAVKDAAAADPLRLAQYFRPKARQYRNVITDGRKDSLKIRWDTGFWFKDFESSAGGDAIAFVQAQQGGGFRGALDTLEWLYGITPDNVIELDPQARAEMDRRREAAKAPRRPSRKPKKQRTAKRSGGSWTRGWSRSMMAPLRRTGTPTCRAGGSIGLTNCRP